MDGTLLNGRHTVSEETVQLIKDAQNSGIEFLVATGRAYNEARYVLDQVNIKCPAICVNGGEIRDENGNIEFAVSLDGKVCKEIEKVFNELNIYFELYTEKGTYTMDEDMGVEIVTDIYHSANPSEDRAAIRQVAKGRFLEGLIDSIDSYDKLFIEGEGSVYKFLAFALDEELLKEVQNRLREIEGVEVTSSGRNNIEVMHKEARKGTALQRFVESKGISLQDTMALGDNYNDISMLSIVGHSVAMGNAEQPVKDIAKAVTDTNSNDGVAQMIKKALAQQNLVK